MRKAAPRAHMLMYKLPDWQHGCILSVYRSILPALDEAEKLAADDDFLFGGSCPIWRGGELLNEAGESSGYSIESYMIHKDLERSPQVGRMQPDSAHIVTVDRKVVAVYSKKFEAKRHATTMYPDNKVEFSRSYLDQDNELSVVRDGRRTNILIHSFYIVAPRGNIAW